MATEEGSQAARPGRRRRRWPWVAGAIVAVLVIGLGTLVVLVRRGRPAGEAELGAAVTRYDQSGGADAAGAGTGLPPTGVYPATGSGHEQLSIQTTAQPIGPTVPVTITAGDPGCVVVRVDVNAAHWQSWTWCQRDGVLVDTGGQVSQNIDLVITTLSTTATTSCDPPEPLLPPGMAAGQSWPIGPCAITSQGAGTSQTVGITTVVGPEALTIGGQVVHTWRLRDHKSYAGSQRGTQISEWWLAADTGMPVRSDWKLDLKTDTPVGDVGYTEDGTWTLDQLTPVGAAPP